MTHLPQLAARLVVAATVVLPFAAQAADPADVVDYRKHVMQTLESQTTALGMIMSTQIPEDNLVLHVEAIALAAKQALKSFEAKVPGGHSKPEVWSNWPDFEKRMKDFVAKTDKLAKDVKTGGMTAVMDQAVDALSCKSCHDVYRKE